MIYFYLSLAAGYASAGAELVGGRQLRYRGAEGGVEKIFIFNIKNRNRNRKTRYFLKRPTKAEFREPAYSQALNQNQN